MVMRTSVILGMALVICAVSDAQRRAVGAEYFVSAGAESGGDGTKATPFASLALAAAASGRGDTIYLVGSDVILDGGIALQPRQKLIGIDSDGAVGTADSPAVRVTNSTEHLDGAVVRLSRSNEVAGIHFVEMRSHAIHGAEVEFSGTRIHDCRFSGGPESEDVIPVIMFETGSAEIRNVMVTDCVIRDAEDMGGVRVMHTGDSSGEYEFARNDFSDLGGRAYLVWSRGTSRIQSRILDSVVDNIGHGERNADSIDPRLWGRSEQHMVVSNYRYNNTKQVGSQSNTGFEAFIMGEPFRDEEEWCDGCKLTLEIVDSVFENTFTDGIQLTNYGSNSVLDFTIRNTSVIGANPKQAGGAISLIAQNQYNSGSQVKLLVEGCDLMDSGKYGFAILDRSGTCAPTVDLGGGALGSKGRNRVLGSVEAEIFAMDTNPVAKHNWWGGSAPRVVVEGDAAGVVFDPVLSEDPGPTR